MLFSFLKERGSKMEIFNQLPFPIQMNIASFFPNLPLMGKLKYTILQYHYNDRFCARCGKIVPICEQKYICLCHQKYKKYRYTSSIREYKTYNRPLSIFEHHSEREERFMIINQKLSHKRCYVASNQSEFLYSFYFFCKHVKDELLYMYIFRNNMRIEDIVYSFIKKIINTNTCLRNYMDLFDYRSETKDPSTQYFHHYGKTITKNPVVITHKEVIQYICRNSSYFKLFSKNDFQMRQIAHSILFSPNL